MISKDKLTRMIRVAGSKKRVLYTYSAASPQIKKQHEAYLAFLDDYFIQSTFSHAYTKNRSIYTNTKMHMFNDIFVKVDVKQFFPSLNHRYLADRMYYELNRKRPHAITLTECREIISNSSVSDIGLPLGLIPSPALSNIYMKRFDGILYGALKKLELTDVIYTRYADDIFISFKATTKDAAMLDDQCKNIVAICRKELRNCHLTINDKKTKFVNLAVSNHVKLAGINIVRHDDGRRRLTVSRKVVRDLYFKALAVYAQSLTANKGSAESLNAEINYVKGMQSFILSIEKTGYSHILSDTMRKHIQSYGYKNMEDLIAKLKPIE